MGDLLGELGGILGKKVQNRKNREYAAQETKARQQLWDSLDHEPMYASQQTPTYQKTQSPVARAYLESILTGNNPATTFSGDINAPMKQKLQQNSFNSMYGTQQELAAKQQALQAETPWKVTAPTRTVVPDPETQLAKRNPDAAAAGITMEMVDAMRAKGGKVGKKYADMLTDPERAAEAAQVGANGWKRIASAYAPNSITNDFQTALNNQDNRFVRSGSNLSDGDFQNALDSWQKAQNQTKRRSKIGMWLGMGYSSPKTPK